MPRASDPDDNTSVNTSETLVVKGTGLGLFEGNVVVNAVFNDDLLIGQEITTLDAPDLGELGTWEVELIFNEIQNGDGKIIVISPSPKSSSEDIIYEIPVTFTSNKASL